MRNKIVEEDLQFITQANIPWEKLAGKTILISGASGFLSSYLVETLLYLNEKKFTNKLKVVALVRNKDKSLKRFNDFNGREDLMLFQQDVCEPFSFFEKVDYIIHAASQASPKYYNVDPVGTFLPNVLGTHNLLKLGTEKKVENFLFFSAGEIYGNIGGDVGSIKEDVAGCVDSTKVRSCYAESKRAGETLCVSWSKQYDLPVNIVRLFHTYGPGFSLDDGRVFADFTADVVNNRDIVLKSDGHAVRAFCYIADFVTGIFTVLLKGATGEVYNLSNPKAILSIEELAEMIAGFYPGKNLKVIRQNRDLKDDYSNSEFSTFRPSIDKLIGLGWSPKFDTSTGFKRTIDSYLTSK